MRVRSTGVLAVAWLAWLSAAACETGADVDHPRSFAKDGISFRYPQNWSVSEDASQLDETGARILFVESPGSAIVIVSHYALGTDLPLDRFAEGFRRSLVAEAGDLVRLGPLSAFTATSGGKSSARSVVAGAPREGVEQLFSISFAGEQVPHRFRAFRVEGAPATAFVVVQAAEEDWNLVAPGFDLVLESLEIQ